MLKATTSNLFRYHSLNLFLPFDICICVCCICLVLLWQWALRIEVEKKMNRDEHDADGLCKRRADKMWRIYILRLARCARANIINDKIIEKQTIINQVEVLIIAPLNRYSVTQYSMVRLERNTLSKYSYSMLFELPSFTTYTKKYFLQVV